MDKRELRYPIITVTMAGGGSFAMELYPDSAPNAVSSVISLAAAGEYDGLTIDRIVPGFVIQPFYQSKGRPRLDCMVNGEFEQNGFLGGRPIGTGMVAMAGDGQGLSSGSEFFITLGEHPRLAGRYSVIGRVVDGWDEIKRLEAVETRPVDSGVAGVEINQPVQPEIMQAVRVETFGIQYPPPALATAE